MFFFLYISSFSGTVTQPFTHIYVHYYMEMYVHSHVSPLLKKKRLVRYINAKTSKTERYVYGICHISYTVRMMQKILRWCVANDCTLFSSVVYNLTGLEHYMTNSQHLLHNSLSPVVATVLCRWRLVERQKRQ